MSKQLIKQFIERKTSKSGMLDTGLKGVQLFRVTEPIRCAPAIYEPSITAIVSGAKEAIWHGEKERYDSSQYICCTMSMPVEAGTPESSPDNPLLGVYISIDTRIMTELAIAMEAAFGTIRKPNNGTPVKGFSVASWDDCFTEALYRLLQLTDNPTDMAILGPSRLRELYYAVLKGESGTSAQRSFGLGNEINRAIEFLSSRLHEAVTIEDMADHIGMSRAVFHRKFKQATNMSPIQFVKSMRLNNAAVKIAAGTNVNVAAMEVGYLSSSQFSREFKRMYGQSPKQWVSTHQINNHPVA